MSIYRIAKWNEVFETAESRRHSSLRWVSMPIGFDSSGYQSMLDGFGDEAPAIYGTWCVLVAVAATCPVRGLLCNSRGGPVKLSHLARRTGFPESKFAALVQWADSPSVRWLEIVSQDEALELLGNGVPVTNGNTESCGNPGQRPVVTQPSAGLPNLTKPNLTKQDNTPPPPNQTGPGPDQDRAGEGRSGGEGEEFVLMSGLVFKEVAGVASQLDRMCPHFDKAFVWECSALILALMPTLLSDIAPKVKTGRISNVRAYLEKAFRRECEERSLSLAKLRLLVPACPVKKPQEAPT